MKHIVLAVALFAATVALVGFGAIVFTFAVEFLWIDSTPRSKQ